MNKVIAFCTVLLFFDVIAASETFDVDAFKQHVRSKGQPLTSIEDVRHAHKLQNAEIHRRRIEAIDNLMRKIQGDWEKDVERMQKEFGRETEQERFDNVWRNMAYWLGLAGNTMMSIAETIDSIDRQTDSNNRPNDGSSIESNGDAPTMSESLRSTTTRTIELCDGVTQPCRVIGVETVIENWATKEKLPDTSESTNLKREIAVTISSQIPSGIVCWSSESGCNLNETNDIVGVSKNQEILNANPSENLDSEFNPDESTSQKDSYSELEAKQRVAKILWNAAEWSTPIPDLIISFTGKNPISGENEGRAGAAASAAAGMMFGPAGKVVAKGGKLIVKGGKIFIGRRLLARANRTTIKKVIKSMEGRTGREVFGEIPKTIGANSTFEKLGPTGIRKALSKSPFIWSKHTIKRLSERRTKKLGINTPQDVINVLNNGRIYDAKGGSIAIQSLTNRIEVIVDVGSRTVTTVRPLRIRP